MRILLDLQGAQTPGSRNRGIGRYSLSLAQAMARAAGPEIDIRIALNAAFPEAAEAIVERLEPELPRSAFSRYHTLQGTYPPRPDGDPVQEINAQLVRALYASLQPDAVLTTSVMEGYGFPDYCPAPVRLPGVVEAAVLYDLIPLVLPDLFLFEPCYEAFYRRQVDVLKECDLLLAISCSSKDDAARLLQVGPDRVTNIQAAVHSIFREAPRREAPEGLPRSPYVLFAGGVDRNKNIGLVIDAFGRLPEALRSSHALVHVGILSADARSKLERHAAASGIEVTFMGYVDDRTLIDAYDHAQVFVFPSLYEGFGLPVLEAMTRSTPVLASRGSSLPEVVGDDDAALFNPHDADDLAGRLAAFLSDADLRGAASERAQARALAFSWDCVARRAFEAIGCALPRRGTGPARPARHAPIGIEETIRACAEPITRARIANAATHVVDALLGCARPGHELGAPRLIVDVTEIEARDQRTGIQRVVRKTIEEILSLGPAGVGRETQPVVFADLSPHASKLFGRGDGEAVTFRGGDLLLMLDSNWLQYPQLDTHFQALRAARGTIVTTVYDLVPLLYPNVVAQGMRDAFEAWFRRALIESDGLVCISRAVADEVIDYVERHDLPFRDGLRIGWWHLGSDLEALDEDGSVRPELETFLARQEPIFLMVGTVEPRKRHAVVLDALEELWREGSEARLLLIGKAGWADPAFIERLRSHPERRRLKWVEGASDGEVNAAYRVADALIFASVYEGFGLPIVEAARLGLPVIASDIPVLREVGGDGAAYFAVDDASALAARLRSFLAGDRPDPSRIRARSWEESAHHLLEVLFEDRWYHVLRHRNRGKMQD